MPLDCKNAIDADEILEKIAKIKDSDGLTRENAGHLARGEFDKITAPCTPRACLHIIQAITGRTYQIQCSNPISHSMLFQF